MEELQSVLTDKQTQTELVDVGDSLENLKLLYHSFKIPFSTDDDIAETVTHIMSDFPRSGDFMDEAVPVRDNASPLERAVAVSGRDPHQEV